MAVTYEEAIEALKAADAAGNVEDAQKLAAIADRLRPQEEPEEETPGFLDYLTDPLGTGKGLAEIAATLGTGALAEPVSGYAGIVGGLLPGEEGQAADVTRKVQELMTYTPRTGEGKQILGAIGNILSPVLNLAEKVKAGAGEIGYKIGGPLGGAIGATTPAAIIEILGLGGTRKAKKLALRSALKKVNPADLIDEVGDLLPEIKQGLDKAGIDISEIEAMLPDKAPDQLEGLAQEVGQAATTKIGAEKQIGKIAEEVQPSPERLDALQSLGLEGMEIPSHVSQNPTYIALEQGLKSVPASQLAVREKALMLELGKKADDLILEFGGEIDKAGLSDAFRTNSRQIINQLEDSASAAYDKISEIIPANAPISANNTLEMIAQNASDLGGMKYLDIKESELLKVLSGGAKPTYARLDKYRKQVGQALRRGSGPFKDADEGALKRLYGALTQDQKLVAESFGAGDLYNTATGLIVQRKTIEEQLIKSLGRDLAGSITSKARPAMLALQRGDTKQLDTLLESIPDELGSDIRRSVVVTSLNDAFTQGSRMERSLNIPGFDDFMVGLKRNPAAYKRLSSEIGADGIKRLETLHTVVSGVREAQKHAISTGRIAAVPGMFDEAQSLTKRLYGAGKKVAAAEGVSTMVGLPGAGTAGVVGTMLSAKKTARSVAADELLASSRFQKLIKEKASGRLQAGKGLEKAEIALENLKEYQKWKTTLPEADLSDLITVGALGYFVGERTGEEE